MHCPNCKTPLSIAERKGIEIDFCPDCRGVWLDRGELDKIIELSVGERHVRTAHPGATYTPYRKDHHYHKPYYKHKKRKSLIGELFDIF